MKKQDIIPYMLKVMNEKGKVAFQPAWFLRTIIMKKLSILFASYTVKEKSQWKEVITSI